ncbi:MAG: hypothetical protein ACI4BB_13435 [Coprococcus sp.]
MIFAKAELLCTYSAQTYYQAIDILREHHIEYSSKVINQRDASVIGAGRGRTGSLGINPEAEHLYYIYVAKKDLEKSAYLINNIPR